MDIESFNYVICSDERINTAANQIYYDINFGNFNSPYEEYELEVVNCVVNGGVLSTNGYISLIATGLNEGGVFCKGLLNPDDSLICSIPTNIDTLMSSGGVRFRVKNCRMSKLIRFALLKPSFAAVESGVDINVGDETRWVLTLRMTPVKK